ncbi:MAG: sunset domain-containing protein, partial [Aggregatilineales bacterium]
SKGKRPSEAPAFRRGECHVERFQAAQRLAREQGAGLWGACNFEAVPQATTIAPAPPSTQGGCPQGCQEQQPGCLIKGNISSKGEKIYHVPGARWYDRTKIDPSKGERWFCSPEEAERNGWRAAKD